MTFKSMADELYATTDCRCIYMEVQFQKADLDKIKSGVQLLVRYMQNLMDGHIVAKWVLDEHSISDSKLLEAVANADHFFDLYTEGNVITPYVYNKRTLHEFEQTLEYDWTLPRLRHSPDYWDYIDQCFADKHSDHDLKEAIYKLFYETERTPLGNYNSFDISCRCFTSPYANIPFWGYGHMRIELALGCISEYAQELASSFSRLMKQLCMELGDASGRVGVNHFPSGQYCSPYMRYFGCNTPEIRNLICPPNYHHMEWAPYHYLCGIEWANVISASVQERLPNLSEDAADHPNIIHEALPNGSVFLGLAKPILSVTPVDLLALRDLVDDVLYPGCSINYDLSEMRNHNDLYCPRYMWEIVPMREDDIIIENGILHFVKSKQKQIS